MVDHRADEDRDFRVFVTSDRPEPFSLRETWASVVDWVFGGAAQDSSVARARTASDPHLPATQPPTGARRLAVLATVLWVLVLGAYGVGYFQRLEAGDAGSRLLPTLDLLFFVFAIAGPVAMVWLVVNMMERATHLTRSIADQSESALVLSATLANLNDTVDALSAGTTGRLEQACDRMEREASASVEALERKLQESSSKLDSAMEENLRKLDRHMTARATQLEQAFDSQQNSLHERMKADASHLAQIIETEASAIRDRSAAFGSALERQRGGLEQRIDQDAERLATLVEAEVQALAEVRTMLSREIAAGIMETRKTLEKADQGLRTRQKASMDETNERLNHAVDAMTARVSSAQDAQARMFRENLAEPLDEIRQNFDETRKSIVAHPPASVHALADMLGKTAQGLIRHDRIALEKSLVRIEELHAQAKTMLDTIDRTSRLNPLMEGPQPAIAVPSNDNGAETSGQELPFGPLPRSGTRSTLNWTAALQVLSDVTPRAGTRHLIERAMADPDIASLKEQSDRILQELSDDKIFVEDMTPEHMPAGLWARFGQGERGGDIQQLAGTSEDVTEALVRARIRSNREFHAMAIRFVASYAALIERAAADIGIDSRLVELADTKPGRAFVLLGGLLGVFERPAPAVLREA